MIGVFLDDERNPKDVTWLNYQEGIEWYIVRRMADFLSCIHNMEEENYIISFDHDLQDFNLTGTENTGYDCLKSLVDFCIDNNMSIPVCLFHTQNPVGKENMSCYYENAKKFIDRRT